MLQSTQSPIGDLFEDYAQHGFLPDTLPLTRLPNPYYQVWEELANQLPVLIQTNQIRNEIDHLPVCTTDYLQTEPEWRRAYAIMGYFAHAYIWGGDQPQEVCSLYPEIPFRATKNTTNTLSSASPPLSGKAIPRDCRSPRTTCLRDLCGLDILELQAHTPWCKDDQPR